MSEDSKGKVDEAKGKAKQAAGDLTGNDDLNREGTVDEKAGEARQKLSDAGEKVGDGVEKVADKAKDAVGGGDNELDRPLRLPAARGLAPRAAAGRRPAGTAPSPLRASIAHRRAAAGHRRAAPMH